MTNELGRNVCKGNLEKTAGVRDRNCGIGTLRWREFFPDRCEFRYALQTAVSFLRTSSIE
jgi:hypothetical protein